MQTHLQRFLPFISRLKRLKPFKILAAIWLVYAFYLTFLASDQYESTSYLVVKSTDGGNAFDPAAMFLSNVTSVSVSGDSQIVEAYVNSIDMINLLDEELKVREYFMADSIDVFSRLSSDHSREELSEYLSHKIQLTIDASSSLITLTTRAFDAEFAEQLNRAVVKNAEQFINQIGFNLAKAKLDFATSEHSVVEQKLQASKQALLAFQSKHGVLDPSAEGAALQQIAFSLEATLAQKRAELVALSSTMAPNAPDVIALKKQIDAIERQIQIQKEKVSVADTTNSSFSVNELMAMYSNLQVQAELAMQAYSSSLVTLEKARVEAYQQLKYLVTIQSPSMPEESTYPNVAYNLTLLGVIMILVFGILKLAVATVKEL